jgi:SPOR domain
MLRLLVVLLFLANVAFFAWTQGFLASAGFAPQAQTEPARMDAQIKPDALRLLSNTEARRIEISASIPAKLAECLQSPLLTDNLASTVRTALEALPAGSWALEATDEPGRWIVYMGPYKTPDTLAKKKSELRGLGISYDTPQREGLLPGISLGGHASQAEANQALIDLRKQGARSARVAQEVAPVKGQLLRLPVVDDALRAQLEPVKTALGAQSLRSCKS